METNLVAQVVELLLVGMGIVFTFLILAVFMTKGKILKKFLPQEEMQTQTINVVLEAKTKLTKYIADEQRKKVQKYIKHDNMKIFNDYLLIGFNHDNTMEDLMYFQKKYPIASSNNNIEIGFRYPLPATEDKVIYCMASTNYIQLKEALINFFNTELYA